MGIMVEKIIHAIFIGSICVLPTNAQMVYFNKTYDYNNEVEPGGNLALTSNGDYLTLRQIITGTFRGFIISKIDSYGDIVWEKLYKKDNIAIYAYAINTTIDEQFIICGSIWRDVSNYDSLDGFFLKIDENGDTIWSKIIGNLNKYDVINQAIQTEDSGFVLVGTSSGFSPTQDMYLARTDSKGDVLWERVYGGSQVDIGWSVVQTIDSGYLITGYTNSYGAGDYDIYLIKANNVGVQQWQKTFGGPLSDGPAGIIKTNDQNYLITAALTSSNLSVQGYMIKIDINGGKLWDIQYGGTQWESIVGSAVEEKDGSIMVIGGIVGTTPPDNYPIGWLMKTSSNGDSLWSRTFKIRQTDNYFVDIKQTNDNGFIIGGYVFGDGSGNSEDMWLVKVDSCGCDTPICDIVCAKIGMEEQSAVNSKQLMTYPNPAGKGGFWLSVSGSRHSEKKLTVVITDVMGRKTGEYKISGNQQKISTDEYANSIYFLALYSEGQFVGSQKFAVAK